MFFQVVLALFVLLLALLLLVFQNGVVTLLLLLVCQLPIPWGIYALHVCLLIFEEELLLLRQPLLLEL